MGAKYVTEQGEERPSLSAIARDTGLDPSHISKVLNGRPCRLQTARDIADAMGITMDELYERYIQAGAWGIR